MINPTAEDRTATTPDPPVPTGPAGGLPVDLRDGVFALVVLVFGYLWWDWITPRSDFVPLTSTPEGGGGFYQYWLPGVAVSALFALALGISLAYYRLRGLPVSRGARLGAGAILLATGPFALYATTPAHLLLGLVLIAAFLTWHASISRVVATPQDNLALDGLNQGLAPLRNLGAWWTSLRSLLRGHRHPAQILTALLGLLVALPVIVVVIWLLMSADAGFQHVADRLIEALGQISLGRVLWQIIFAIPVAVAAMGLLYANGHRRGQATITPDRLAETRRVVQRIPLGALATPLALLVVIYLVFLAAMASYLFSGFAGQVPGGFTYADYARRGFFELTVVAVINSAALAFTYLFAQRCAEVYPRVLRWLGVILSAQTVLLVATSISKMVLYAGAFGLTRLRLWVMAFLVVLFVAGLLVLVRHLVRFPVVGPLIGLALAVFVALMWANPDGLVARYNVSHYQAGDLATIDVGYLGRMGDAATSALIDLSHDADAEIAARASRALLARAETAGAIDAAGGGPWTAWTWQSRHARSLLRELP